MAQVICLLERPGSATMNTSVNWKRREERKKERERKEKDVGEETPSI